MSDQRSEDELLDACMDGDPAAPAALAHLRFQQCQQLRNEVKRLREAGIVLRNALLRAETMLDPAEHDRCEAAIKAYDAALAAPESSPAAAPADACKVCGHVHGFDGICAVPLDSARLCACRAPSTPRGEPDGK